MTGLESKNSECCMNMNATKTNCRLCYYTMESLLAKQRFLSDIRSTFGYGGLNCSLSDRDLSDYHNFLERDFNFTEAGRSKVGVRYVGRQMTGKELKNIWVLNPDVHINSKGERVSLPDSEYMWQPIGGPCIETVYGKNSNKIDIRSTIQLPLESTESLSNLLTSLKLVLKHNFIPGS